MIQTLSMLKWLNRSSYDTNCSNAITMHSAFLKQDYSNRLDSVTYWDFSLERFQWNSNTSSWKILTLDKVLLEIWLTCLSRLKTWSLINMMHINLAEGMDIVAGSTLINKWLGLCSFLCDMAHSSIYIITAISVWWYWILESFLNGIHRQ